MFFRKKEVINKDLTIVLQGLPNPKCLNLWIKNYNDWNVIISTWDSVDLSQYSFPKHWRVIQTQYPLFRSKPKLNLDYQIETTLRGLYKVETPYVIKARLDEYYSNLDIILDKVKKDEEKIVSSSMYFRKRGFSNGVYRFHIGDKILGGTTDNLILMFESTIQNIQEEFWNSDNPEGQLGLGYIMGKEVDFDFYSIRGSLNNVKEVKPKMVDIIKYLGSTLNDIVTNASFISTRFVSNLVRDIDMDDVHHRLTEMKSRISWLDTQFSKHNSEVYNDDDVFLKKWFVIQNINELKPFIATRNFGERGRVNYEDEFDHKREECITDVNDY